jgi:prophage tail gpP-like protein
MTPSRFHVPVLRWLALPLLALALLLAAAPAPAAAQVPERMAVSDTLVEVRLADGSVLFGRVVAVDGDRVTLQTEAGARVEVDRAQIRSLRPVRGHVEGGEVWQDDPHAGTTPSPRVSDWGSPRERAAATGSRTSRW